MPAISWNKDNMREVQELISYDFCQVAETVAEKTRILVACYHFIFIEDLKVHHVSQHFI
jgi:hypothetical protein